MITVGTWANFYFQETLIVLKVTRVMAFIHIKTKMFELLFQVLFVEPERKRLRLTHKKTLVNSELPLITNYSDIKLGMKSHGFITSIRDYGCIVHFYNNVRGLVLKTELG